MRIVIRQEGAHVLLNFDDKFFVQLEAAAARELWAQLSGQIALAEEYEQAERIIRDSAILLRAGAPIALSSNPKIVDAAKQSAAWDSDLRRYMPMKGITSQESFGTPRIIQTGPKVTQ